MQIFSENFGASDGAAGDFFVCLTSDSVEFSCRKHDSVDFSSTGSIIILNNRLRRLGMIVSKMQ